MRLLVYQQEIHPNSPAAQAGLIPHTDYILGSEMMTAGDDDLYSLIESHDHQEIKLYVYNADTESCREVSNLTSHTQLVCSVRVWIHVPFPPLPPFPSP